VANLLLNNIVYRYGVPHKLISAKGGHVRKEVAALIEKCKI